MNFKKLINIYTTKMPHEKARVWFFIVSISFGIGALSESGDELQSLGLILMSGLALVAASITYLSRNQK